MDKAQGNAYGFTLEATQVLPGLELVAHTWQHSCGLRHIHLECDDPELSFTIAFPTRPSNDTGVAHVLEHLVLCGSRQFPVRDPFFNMLRRSVATYANAQTGPDHTRYPFSTTDAQDYWNLMDVYLDAVFFPQLHDLDFDQEAVRLVLPQDGKPASFDGVVFNEMMGARSSATSFIPMLLARAVAPESPYARDFGGAPEHLPELTVEAVRQFHAHCYHPSRALMMSYGRVDAQDIQERLWKRAGQLLVPAGVPDQSEAPAAWPARVEAMVPQEEAGKDQHMWIRLWKLPAETAGQSLLSGFMAGLVCEEGQALSLALDNLGFGQRMALGTTRMGTTLALVVMVGHLSAEQLPLVEQAVENAMAEQARIGVDPALIQAMRDGLEMSQRTVSRQAGMGIGLQLMGEIAERWAWTGTANTQAIDLDSAVAEVEAQMDGDGFARFMDTLAHTRTTTIHGIPDPDYFPRRRMELEEKARARMEAMDGREQSQLRTRAEQLRERQTKAQDTQVLPILGLDEVETSPAALAPIQWEEGRSNRAAMAHVSVPLRGMVEASIVFDVGHIQAEQLPWLALALELWDKMPIGWRTWTQSEQWRSRLANAPSARLSHGSILGSRSLMGCEVGFSSVALERNAEEMRLALMEAVVQTRFDDGQRVRFLLAKAMAGRERQLGRLGQAMAGRLARAWLSPRNTLAQVLSGPEHLAFMAGLNKQLAEGKGMDETSEALGRVMDWVRAQPCLLRSCSSREPSWTTEEADGFANGWRTKRRQAVEGPIAAPTPLQAAVLGPAELACTYQVLAGPPLGHEDEAAMAVACELISSGFLHGALRERGGAYGGGLSYQEGELIFNSYRDPRLVETLADFEQARSWLGSAHITPIMLQEAILARLGNINQPDAPMDKAFRSWECAMAGIDDTYRRRMRHNLVAVTLDQVREAAARWLDAGAPSSRVAFIGPAHMEQAQSLGLAIEPLQNAWEDPAPRRTPHP